LILLFFHSYPNHQVDNLAVDPPETWSVTYQGENYIRLASESWEEFRKDNLEDKTDDEAVEIKEALLAAKKSLIIEAGAKILAEQNQYYESIGAIAATAGSGTTANEVREDLDRMKLYKFIPTSIQARGGALLRNVTYYNITV